LRGRKRPAFEGGDWRGNLETAGPSAQKGSGSNPPCHRRFPVDGWSCSSAWWALACDGLSPCMHRGFRGKSEGPYQASECVCVRLPLRLLLPDPADLSIHKTHGLALRVPDRPYRGLSRKQKIPLQVFAFSKAKMPKHEVCDFRIIDFRIRCSQHPSWAPGKSMCFIPWDSHMVLDSSQTKEVLAA